MTITIDNVAKQEMPIAKEGTFSRIVIALRCSDDPVDPCLTCPRSTGSRCGLKKKFSVVEPPESLSLA